MKSRACLIALCALFTHSLLAGDGYGAGEAKRLLRDSTHIIVGQVVGKRSEKTEDGRMILTRYTLRVEKAIKGDTAATMEITEYGGVVGNQATYVSHSANYVEGHRYLVFVNRDSLGYLRTMSGPRGLLPVVPAQSGKSVVRLYPSHPLATLLPGRSSLWDLDDLAGRLRNLVSDTAVQDK